MSDVTQISEDQRIEAWTAVWDKVRANNPDFHGHARSGLESVLRELNRLYDIERKYAVLAVRNGSLGEGGRSE